MFRVLVLVIKNESESADIMQII